ncbi:MAG: hypothetical protein IKP40_04150 [Clostridia bacterium]|nr:hypothetical protein [Clostridia bacterium]
MIQRLRGFVSRHQDAYLLSGALLCTMFVIASFIGIWPWSHNWYNTYSLQAVSWLEGRLDLGQDYSWLELAIYDGKYYCSFPPFPSLLMLPFALVFGTQTPDGFIAAALAIVTVFEALQLARELGLKEGERLYWCGFLLFANGWLWLVMNGYVWFIAQTLCFLLSLAAIRHAYAGRGGWALSWWACAVGCRPMCALYLPVLMILLVRALRQRQPDTSLIRLVLSHLRWAIGPVLIAAFYMWLNWARFGNPLEFGHNYLPEFQRAEHGQFSLTYLKDNIKAMLRFPLPYGDSTKLNWPQVNGTAFYLVNPLILVSAAVWFSAFRRRGESGKALYWLLPLLSFVYALFIACHRTLGGWHFGNRYLVDIMPWLFLGVILWKPSRRLTRLTFPLMALGTALQLVGTVVTYNHWPLH